MFYVNLAVYSVLKTFLFIQGSPGDQTTKEQKVPSAADVIEHRIEPADKAEAESTQQEEYFEGSSPGSYGSFVDHKDGRLMFIVGTFRNH